MFRLILRALSLFTPAGYAHVFEAAGPGWDPNGSPVPQGGSGWDPNGLS
jgi:hypothetical protein